MMNYYLLQRVQALQHMLYTSNLTDVETDVERLYQAYYQPSCLWTGGKVIKELHKITSMSRKDIKSRLAKQALWKGYMPLPKEINLPHYKLTKPNEQHQFDLLYMPHNIFEGNTYKHIFKYVSGIDVASR